MAAGRRTRILIVDDSAVMRSLLRSVIATDPALEVAGTAADGASALNALALNCPDLLLLDMEMPVMDGLATLRELRQRGHSIPIIMCSSLTQRGAKVTIEALAVGASDYVAKPSNQASREEATRLLAQELIPKIHALVRPSQPCAIGPRAPWSGRPASAASVAAPLPSESPRVVAVGVSTGGPAALEEVFPALPADFPIPILVVQHMPEVFTRLFAERLNRRCRLHVCEASEGAPALAGTLYIARGNWHLEALAPDRPGAPATLHLNQNSPENHCRPAADALFRSVARVYRSGVLAVVLTGMGSDGLAGCRLIRNQGGIVLAQDEATSTVWGMPGAVVQAGLAHKVLPLGGMAPEILRIARRFAKAPTRSSLAPMVA
jgi:two-component system, chemotaxis family, protein-glutamate methylesterase/glutaminase